MTYFTVRNYWISS